MFEIENSNEPNVPETLKIPCHLCTFFNSLHAVSFRAPNILQSLGMMRFQSVWKNNNTIILGAQRKTYNQFNREIVFGEVRLYLLSIVSPKLICRKHESETQAEYYSNTNITVITKSKESIL